jgi:pyruvate/2-oxoglutarate/acetoin dehydrogenase E1 component
MSYYDCLRDAMTMLAADERTLFVGQGVRWPNNAQFGTFKHVPEAQRIELPVIEDFQAGYCLGLAMAGFLPVCVFARWDFALLAANQIVSHIDKLPLTSFSGRVIIRVGVGARWPLDSGKQHTNDYTAAFRLMCRTIEFIELNCARDVIPGYERALRSSRSCIVVERADLYGEGG